MNRTSLTLIIPSITILAAEAFMGVKGVLIAIGAIALINVAFGFSEW